MLTNNDKAVFIKWGLKPNIMRDIELLGLSADDSVEVILDMISSGRDVSSYLNKNGVRDDSYTLFNIRLALNDVLRDRYDSLGKALEKFKELDKGI